MSEMNPLEVKCPLCDAGPGEECVDPCGGIVDIHGDRLGAVDKAFELMRELFDSPDRNWDFDFGRGSEFAHIHIKGRPPIDDVEFALTSLSRSDLQTLRRVVRILLRMLGDEAGVSDE